MSLFNKIVGYLLILSFFYTDIAKCMDVDSEDVAASGDQKTGKKRKAPPIRINVKKRKTEESPNLLHSSPLEKGISPVSSSASNEMLSPEEEGGGDVKNQSAVIASKSMENVGESSRRNPKVQERIDSLLKSKDNARLEVFREILPSLQVLYMGKTVYPHKKIIDFKEDIDRILNDQTLFYFLENFLHKSYFYGEGCKYAENNLDKASDCFMKVVSSRDSFLVTQMFAENFQGVDKSNIPSIIHDLEEEALNKLHDLSDQKIPNAMYNLGKLYKHGEGVSQDLKKARALFGAATSKGHKDAAYELGLLYKQGEGITEQGQNRSNIALSYFSISAEKGQKDAQYELGLRCGRQEAIAWFAKAAAQGHREALEALKNLHKQHNDSDAQYNLGLLYKESKGVQKDLEEAEKWFEKSAANGHRDAQYNLGLLLARQYKNFQHFSIGNYELKQAIKWFMTAAKAGHEGALKELNTLADQGIADAQYELGLLYGQDDSDVKLDIEKAKNLFEKAAAQGHEKAIGIIEKNIDSAWEGDRNIQYKLGLWWQNENLDKSIEWWVKAAKEGHKKALEGLTTLAKKKNSRAQYELGLLYEKGEGVGKNLTKSLNWLLLAAKNGHEEALEKAESIAAQGTPEIQYKLGVLYKNGSENLEQDLKKSAKWIAKAAKSGHGEALEELQAFASQGSPHSQYKLGSLYRKALGVAQDIEKAADWQMKAAREDEYYREKLCRLLPTDKKYEKVVKEKECEYINNKSGILNKSLGNIVLFRGLHYVKNLFKTEDLVNEHVALDDTDTFLVSSAACELTGESFLSGLPGEEELQAGKLVDEVLRKFKADSENLYHKFHNIYTNNHDMFHDYLEHPENADEELTREAFQNYRWIFQNLAEPIYPDTWQKAVIRNPFVSFSTNATHGLRYGMGQKSFTGGEKVKLNPQFTADGAPQNRYLGKVYIALLSPLDLWKLNPTFVVAKHAQNKLDIFTQPIKNIFSEDEVSFFGYVPSHLVKASHVLKIPNLSREEKSSYKKINENFNTEKGMANKIISAQSPKFEEKASELVTQNNSLRLYSDIFENYYTSIPDNSDKMRVAKWLHDINAKGTQIVSVPLPGTGGARTLSIQILATNLNKIPLGLQENWASSLRTINISSCKLANSGAFFVQILNNKRVFLQDLSLTSCQLTKKDTKEIGKHLTDNSKLQNLVLDDNTVEDEGAIEFATALQKNQTLLKLSLSSTKIKDIKPFAALFPTGGQEIFLNKTLIDLKLDYDLNTQDLKTIQKGLARNLEKTH